MGGAIKMEEFELPEILELIDFGGDFNSFLNAVYTIFNEDFVRSKPTFEGRRLGLKRHPIVDGREYTFYHMTHHGRTEDDRTPDLRRMERISWPRPMIDDSTHAHLKVWRNVRRGNGGRKNRILILHEEEKYLVVLDDRGDYILPWTAYYLTNNHKMQKHLREYEAYRRSL